MTTPETGAAACPRCSAPLTPGARFCHHCGTPAGAVVPQPQQQPRSNGMLPWGVAGVALLALVALLAARGLNQERGGGLDASRNTGPQSSLNADPFGASIRAPDISQLSPEERADRLYNRVMALASRDKRDSVAFFAPMAIESYRLLEPLNDDQHYDVGRVAEVAGALPLARAHADSILARSPTHLLGLILAARVADLQGNTEMRRNYERRLLAAEAGELRAGRAEYERHREEIVQALAAARRSVQ